MGPKESRNRIYMVYTGAYFKTGKGLVDTWTPIEPDENDGSPLPMGRAYRAYTGKSIFKGRPGVVISIEEDDEGAVYPGTAKYKGLWSNAEDVTRWQANYDANRMQQRAAKSMKKDIRRSFPKETLDPLRQAYRNEASWERRSLMLAEFIRYITG